MVYLRIRNNDYNNWHLIYKNNRKKAARRQRIAPVGELTEELSSVLADEGETPEEAYLRRETAEIIRITPIYCPMFKTGSRI